MWAYLERLIFEAQLVKICTDLLIRTESLPKRKAIKRGREMLVLAKQKMRKTRQDRLPENFGTVILENEKKDPAYMEMNVKRQEGLKDEDVTWYWNMHPLERCILAVIDEEVQSYIRTQFIQKGFSPEEAAKMVRTLHPVYGDPNVVKEAAEDDRPLLPELKRRVNRWINKNRDNPSFAEQLKEYSTVNAFIRAEIKKGNI